MRECNESLIDAPGAQSPPLGSCVQVLLRPLLDVCRSVWMLSRSSMHISVRDSLRQCKLSTARSLVRCLSVRSISSLPCPSERKAGLG